MSPAWGHRDHLPEAPRREGQFRYPHRQAWLRRATARARAELCLGDRVTRRKCGGGHGTLVFTGWDGDWVCGKTVDDCAAVNIISVNGHRVDFTGGEPDPGKC